MMSGPLPASTAAAVLGCSWSPVTVSMVTWTLFASENSLAWRLISASAAGTKLTHCRRRICAPALGLGIAPAGVGADDAGLPPQAAISGPAASPAAVRPDVLRKSRRLHSDPRTPMVTSRCSVLVARADAAIQLSRSHRHRTTHSAEYPSSAMASAIAFRSVTKRFPDGTLGLADATWHVAEGVHACLLGGSGSGKTTAVRMLQAALRPTGGSVLLLGVPVDGPGYREVRGRLGIVPQGPGMYPDLTAGEYMSLASRLYDARPERAIDALDLGEYLRTRMTYLSPNFQRRLALAAALVADPDVLLLDEPTY